MGSQFQIGREISQVVKAETKIATSLIIPFKSGKISKGILVFFQLSINEQKVVLFMKIERKWINEPFEILSPLPISGFAQGN